MTDKIKITLNDDNIRKLKPADAGTRYDAWDIVLPGLSVRVSESGAKSFTLSAKLPGMNNTTRLTIGPVGKFTLAQARQIARDWLLQISEGKDPRGVVRAKQAAQVKEVDDAVKHSFRAVAQSYIATRLGHLTPHTRAAVMRNIALLMPSLAERRFDSIRARDIIEVIVPLAAKAPGRARVALSHIKTLFAWAVEADYAPASVADTINRNRLLGKPNKRDRALTDTELRRVWQGADKLGYPLGALYQMLILTGCRVNEVAKARRSELDLTARLWIIPAKRMKGGKPHGIPLTDAMLAVLATIPHQGEYLFSFDDGKRPIFFGERNKVAIDRASGVTDWVTHDLRRTMRTALSPKAMGIEFHVAELMIAHRPQGVSTHYDLHTYLDEVREGFEAWNAKAAAICGLPRHGLKLVA